MASALTSVEVRANTVRSSTLRDRLRVAMRIVPYKGMQLRLVRIPAPAAVVVQRDVGAGVKIEGVSHLLHTKQLSPLRALLDELGNVEGEVLDRLRDRNVMLPGGGRPKAVMAFLKPSPPPPSRLRVGTTPVRAHAFFPSIPPGLRPMVVKEGEHLLQMIVVNRSDVLSQLFQSDVCLGFTG